MCIVVKKYLDEHTAIWNSIPAIGRYKNELDANLLAIADKLKTTVESSKPVTQQKGEVKETAVQKAVILAGGLSAHASETGDLRLAELSDFSKSSLQKMIDNQFRVPIDKMITAARELLQVEPAEGMPPLADQGITAEQLTDLENTLDDFSELIGDSRKLQIDSVMHKKAVSELIADMYALLQDKLDKSMKRFETSHPDFYEGYQRARVLVG